VLWFVRSIWFVWLNETNQMKKTNQMNQINQSHQSCESRLHANGQRGRITNMKAPLGKGVFLIAAPSLRDPNFRQTVVLLCEQRLPEVRRRLEQLAPADYTFRGAVVCCVSEKPTNSLECP